MARLLAKLDERNSRYASVLPDTPLVFCLPLWISGASQLYRSSQLYESPCHGFPEPCSDLCPGRSTGRGMSGAASARWPEQPGHASRLETAK